MVIKEFVCFVFIVWSGVVLNFVDFGICKIDFSCYVFEGFCNEFEELWKKIGWIVEEGSCIFFYGVVVGIESYGVVFVFCELSEWVFFFKSFLWFWINGEIRKFVFVWMNGEEVRLY